MEYNSDFYMILPSNVLTDAYLDNKTSDYHTPMPQPINLTGGKWECALTEIFYPHTWYNIKGPLTQFEIRYTSGSKRQRSSLEIPKGYYTPSSFVEQFNKTLARVNTFHGRLEFIPAWGHLVITLNKGESITIHQDLSQMLGFVRKVFRRRKDSEDDVLLIASGKSVDLNASLHQIYIYSDIINETLVGNKFVPLLRIVNVRGSFGENIYTAFQDLHYVEVKTLTINSIEITLRDDQGNPVPFQYGKVIAKLHFRRRRNNILL